ncbi:hypothetical protein LSH36_122g08022 [Paralvinella palmiformis]|uniref:Uncharacterized protein n=1 Tax=Paralvinella palmiformis TaxID=53620 RepID=A0AAD9JXI7_9ANNE|nr:hypothetical protein LSH36_122g08022 [Paralvinella palmiformis]
MARGMFQLTCLLCLLVFVTASTEQDYKTKSYNNLEYKGTEKGSEDSQVYVYPAGFKGGRYYYGGVYRGSCQSDGLYYRDEDSFVVCSNGNAYIQPCAPGTRSSGQHRYSPGYYYGYSDFCDVNLVDQGFGPAHYAPYGVPTYNSPGYGGANTAYNTEKATSYDVNDYGKDAYGYAPIQDGYGSDKNGYAGSYSKDKRLAYPSRTVYSKKETAYEPSGKF